jgi:hypothetical protein
MNPIIINDGVTTGRELVNNINENFNELYNIINSGETGEQIVSKLTNLLLVDKLTSSGVTHNSILLSELLDVITGQTVYTNSTPMPNTLGGLLAGTTFTNVPTTDIFDQLLYPYQNPIISSFAIYGQSALVEVGVILSGLKTFTWTKSNAANITPNVGLIRNTINNTIIKNNIDISGQNSDTATIDIVNDSPTTVSYIIESSNTKNVSINSNIFSINSIYPVFSGFVTQVNRPLSQDIDIINSNKRVIRSNGDTSFTLNSSNSDYSWVAIPQYLNLDQFSTWYVTALNNGNIGGSGNLFDTGESINLTSSLWTNIPYWVYITNYRTPIQTITLKK